MPNDGEKIGFIAAQRVLEKVREQCNSLGGSFDEVIRVLVKNLDAKAPRVFYGGVNQGLVYSEPIEVHSAQNESAELLLKICGYFAAEKHDLRLEGQAVSEEDREIINEIKEKKKKLVLAMKGVVGDEFGSKSLSVIKRKE
jgi:hypothetical protein